MPDIIQTLRDTYTENPAAALNVLPQLFKQYDEGLIKVLPCAIGDTIYEVEKGIPIISYCVTGFVIGKTEFEDDEDVYERHGWQIEYGRPGIDCECAISEFGESLFLTREAAEKALEKTNVP